MHDQSFLEALTIVLCTAGITTVLFQRLRQPVVLGYILAGLIVGPHVPIPLIADRAVVQTLSEVGVVLLMFSLGLEFSLRKLLHLGPSAGLTALIQCSIMLWLGFLVGRLFGWTKLESLFAGAIIAISSTTIIAKAFDEQEIRGKLRPFVIGVLVVEDLIAIVLMSALTALSIGDGLSAATFARTSGRLLLFLIGFAVVGMLVVPRTVRAILRLQRTETTLVATIGLCFAGALVAHDFGYSVALGAFIAGSLVAESGEEKAIEPLVHPVRDMFAAIFFVSVGMMIDPALIVAYWKAIVVLTVVVVVGKVVGVTLGSFLTGNGLRMSVRSGMSLAQIGEFSFIIAGLGVTLGSVGEFLYPVAVAVSAITTLLTPWLIRLSNPAAMLLDRKLPHTLQTFAALYASWIERLRTARQNEVSHSVVRRLVGFLALDALLLAALVIGTAQSSDAFATFLQGKFGGGPGLAHTLVVGVAAAIALPLVVGLVSISRALGTYLAERTLPRLRETRVDLADAPRRAFVITLQLGIALVVCLLLLVVTQPFLTVLQGATALIVLLVSYGIAFWKGATNLQGHVRAGTAMIMEALTSQSKKRDSSRDDSLPQLSQYLPGLGELTTFELPPTSPAAGKTLAQLNVRGLTGATVLAITRGDQGIVPAATETLRPGDRLALAGTREAVAAAADLLAGSSEKPAD